MVVNYEWYPLKLWKCFRYEIWWYKQTSTIRWEDTDKRHDAGKRGRKPVLKRSDTLIETHLRHQELIKTIFESVIMYRQTSYIGFTELKMLAKQ